MLIVNVVDGELGKIWERATYEEALEKAVSVAHDQCPKCTKEAIKEEIEEDTCYVSNQGDICVYLAEPEDD